MSPDKGRTFHKYSIQGAYHWRELNPLHFRHYNPRLLARYQIINQIVKQRVDLKSASGLDIGCGDAALYRYFTRQGAKMVGIDNESLGLQKAQEYLDHPFLAHASAYRLPFQSREFNFVVMSEIIEHLEAPQLACLEVVRILKPGGILVLTTPHRKPSGNLHSAYHVQEFEGFELKDFLNSNFQNVKVWGMYPLSLLKRYTGSKLDARIIRVLVRMVTILGFNPFANYYPLDQGKVDHLIAVGESP